MGKLDVEVTIRSELPIPDEAGTLIKEMTVPVSVYRAATQAAADRSGDEYIGLHTAQEVPRGSLGMLELAARNAHNVDQALQWLARYSRLVSEACKLDVQRTRGEFSLIYHIPGDPNGLGRQGHEFSLALCHRFLVESTLTKIRAISVEFAHPEPRDVTPLVEFFGTENLSFAEDQRGAARGRNRITYSEDALFLPIVSRVDTSLPWLEPQAETLLPAEPAVAPVAPVVPELQWHIRQCLRDAAPPTVSEVAQRLGVSIRTMQRRLSDAGTSFFAVLEAIREELAEPYLQDSRLSIHEIALRLGFANDRGFERAFTRWTGRTPRAYRRDLARTSSTYPAMQESGVSVLTSTGEVPPETYPDDVCCAGS